MFLTLIRNWFLNYINKKKADPSPLAVFRIGFGIMMAISIIRFWSYGWIELLYLNPEFHFKYFGFEWVKVYGNITYLIFLFCLISAIFVALGYRYKLSIVTFFLTFTYIELMDKTTYLNHYYFISSLSFLMCFLPAGKYFSLDNYFSKKTYRTIPKWSIDSLKLFICLIYFFAGIAKLNSDWLFEAQPISIWFKSKYDLPIIGENLMQFPWFHYLVSWCGMLYDIFIPFLLLYSRTRILAFIFVIIFHVLTKIFFPPIGMFPFIMIVSALIFFSPKFHNKIISKFRKLLFIKSSNLKELSLKSSNYALVIVVLFLTVQTLLPLRHLLYPGELFWNEQGYRFSWRVMLMEKRGYSTFKIEDSVTKKFFYVDNQDFLTPFQEKQMSFQPDFILEYAHFLGDHFKNQGHENLKVYVDSFVALNGRPSQRFVDPSVDLYQIEESFKHKNWIIPFKHEIKGF